MKNSIIFFSNQYRAMDYYRKELKMGIMLNSDKITKEEFEAFSNVKLNEIPWYDKCYMVAEDTNLDELKTLEPELGLFQFADPKELYPMSLLDIKSGHKVIDVFACASGVKTIQAGLFLKNTGLLVINSEIRAKVFNMVNKLQSFGITNFIATNSSYEKMLESNSESFDRVIVTPTKDYKDEETNYLKMPLRIRKLKLTENTKKIYRILDKSIGMVKCGGKLLYSTRGNSFLEEKYALNKILKKYPNISISKLDGIKEARMVISDKTSTVKMYILLLEKAVLENNNKKKTYSNMYSLYTKEIDEYLIFEKKYMNISLKDKVVKKEKNFYILPDLDINTENLDVRNIGSFIGFLREDKFIPSYALACMLKIDNVKNYYEIKSGTREYEKYINSKKFRTTLSKGIYLVGVMGHPIGWGRVLNGFFINITKKFIR
ncbi:MAG: hypothetical protein A2Y24_05095 [Clostridiales bacterium GWE2_32_10]|nr:MAG: hypothetical protein A2Y24_05095 [Clostridiales bacterium GWE2_32_10]HBY20038.1 hypothetical protein [Clostridiales bacterium]